MLSTSFGHRDVLIWFFEIFLFVSCEWGFAQGVVFEEDVFPRQMELQIPDFSMNC